MSQNQKHEGDFKTVDEETDEESDNGRDEKNDEENDEETGEEFNEENCFKQRENTADEVVLTFDDGQTMYVSASFLSYASPVFKAMFQHDFKEKETREVKLTGKVHADFQEFLLCLHPGVQRPVDNKNVLRIASIAEEYQVIPTITKCKMVMSAWLSSQTENVGGNNSITNYSRVRVCLRILKKASECFFTEIEDSAVKTLARFGHEVFTGTARRSRYRQPANQAAASLTPTLSPLIAPATQGRRTQQLNQAGAHPTPIFSPSFSFGAPAIPSTTQFKQPAAPFIFKSDQSVLSEAGTFPTIADDPKADCKCIFENLPHRLKCSLLLARLDLCDDGDFR